MAVALSYYNLPRRRPVQRRRDATSVMAGQFDPLPERDILTSCLNHIGPYLEVEKNKEERLKRKAEEKLKEREKKRKSREEAKAAARRLGNVADGSANASTSATNAVGSGSQPESSTASSSSKCFTRPTIHIPAIQRRSVSITPPSSPHYVESTPGSTPGPSMSSGTSRTSSKRPHTPDDEDMIPIDLGDDSAGAQSRPRKKRLAVKKGWKGWVEGSPEPSGKLINLDAVPILQERRTRSGKNFDAIGVGKDSWV